MKVTTLVWASLTGMVTAATVVWIATPPGGARAIAATAATAATAAASESLLVTEIRRDAPLAHYRLAERALGDRVRDEIRGLDGVHGDSMEQAILPYPELVVTNGPFTVEAWVRPRLFDAKHRGIVDVEWPDAPGVQGHRMYTSRQNGFPVLTFGRISNITSQDVVVRFPDDGRMHHVVGTFDGGTLVCVYVDTQKVCGVHHPMPLTSKGALAVIGKRIFSHDQAFVGEVRDVAFYARALSDERIAAHFQAGPL